MWAGIVPLVPPAVWAGRNEPNDTIVHTSGPEVWRALFLFLAIVYLTFSFYYTSMSLLHGGDPEVRDGLYLLIIHGRVAKTLDPAEFKWALAYKARVFTTLWTGAYLFASFLLYGLVKANDARPTS
jgi:hypothetical protein